MARLRVLLFLLCLLGVTAPAFAASSGAQLWTALGGRVTCGIAIHPLNSPPMRLLCSARVVPAPRTKGVGDPGFVFLGSAGRPSLARLSQDSFIGTHAVALDNGRTMGCRPDRRHVHGDDERGPMRERLASRLHDHRPQLPRLLRLRTGGATSRAKALSRPQSGISLRSLRVITPRRSRAKRGESDNAERGPRRSATPGSALASPAGSMARRRVRGRRPSSWPAGGLAARGVRHRGAARRSGCARLSGLLADHPRRRRAPTRARAHGASSSSPRRSPPAPGWQRSWRSRRRRPCSASAGRWWRSPACFSSSRSSCWPRVGPAWALLPIAALALPAAAMAIGGVRLAARTGLVAVDPATVADLPRDGYHGGLGGMFIDLRHMAFPASGTVELAIDGGLRRTIVALPARRCVHVELTLRRRSVPLAPRRSRHGPLAVRRRRLLRNAAVRRRGRLQQRRRANAGPNPADRLPFPGRQLLRARLPGRQQSAGRP